MCQKIRTRQPGNVFSFNQGNQEIMKIKNNNNQLSDEAEAEYKLNNLAGRRWFISTSMRLSDVLRKIE